MGAERFTAALPNEVDGHKAMKAAWLHAKPWLSAGHRMVVEVRQEKRSDAQNRMLHAWLGEISAQLEWAGAKRDTDTWKRLLTAAWLRARGDPIEILPAVDGHGIDVVFKRTSQLTKAECAELSEFVIAWAVEHGVGAN